MEAPGYCVEPKYYINVNKPYLPGTALCMQVNSLKAMTREYCAGNTNHTVPYMLVREEPSLDSKLVAKVLSILQLRDRQTSRQTSRQINRQIDK